MRKMKFKIKVKIDLIKVKIEKIKMKIKEIMSENYLENA